ncbi:hypothetical protein ThidrDRAFT_1803 [Thiorhodococcus drewsii AZ1]|uniref:Uncharacterized protein n=1 Tax=Thiorhodococcus drewsii AZ1 TaxID=765913 RepID=G2E0J0_9GAMM|nr:hypothetical protein [Thiorhodococcus drewsii]EGV31918.1 hypothetical protein ThidrDRAFT_1803 [Thiorhodococcus drewsii AZ1]
MTHAQFSIRFDGWYEFLSTLLLLPPSTSYVSISRDLVEVRMGWAFSARFPRTAIASVASLNRPPVSRGVHGFAGRWLVNGSGRGILTLDLKPAQRGYVMGFPVRLRELQVSLERPEDVSAMLLSRADT